MNFAEVDIYDKFRDKENRKVTNPLMVYSRTNLDDVSWKLHKTLHLGYRA